MMIDYSGFDYIRFFEDRGIEYVIGGKNLGPRDIGIKCLFCDDRSYHLVIHLDKGIWHCWRCGEKGTLWSLISEIEKTDDRSLIISILKQYGNSSFELSGDRTSGKEDRLENYLGDLVKIEDLVEREDKGFFWNLFLCWASTRRIGLAEFMLYGCYLPTRINSYFAYRLVVPIFAQDSRTKICWVGRDMTGRSNIRYLPVPTKVSPVSYQSCLYTVVPIVGPIDKVVLVEGIFDAWRVDGVSEYIPIATLGKVLSRVQKNKLIKLITENSVKEVVIMFDGDGVEEAEKLSNLLDLYCDHVRVCCLKPGEDPDSLNEKDLRELLITTREDLS
jgi:DNA primase